MLKERTTFAFAMVIDEEWCEGLDEVREKCKKLELYGCATGFTGL